MSFVNSITITCGIVFGIVISFAVVAAFMYLFDLLQGFPKGKKAEPKYEVALVESKRSVDESARNISKLLAERCLRFAVSAVPELKPERHAVLRDALAQAIYPMFLNTYIDKDKCPDDEADQKPSEALKNIPEVPHD